MQGFWEQKLAKVGDQAVQLVEDSFLAESNDEMILVAAFQTLNTKIEKNNQTSTITTL